MLAEARLPPVALYNFLFVDPRYSLSLIDRGYPGMFFIMFVVSLVSSSIALALRRALAQAAASDRRTHMVLETNRMLQRCADQHQIVHAMPRSWRVFRAVRSCGTAPTPRAMTCCRVRRTRAVGDAAPVHELAPQMPPRALGVRLCGYAARCHLWRIGVLWHLPDGSHRRRLRALGRPRLGGGRAGYRCRARRADT